MVVELLVATSENEPELFSLFASPPYVAVIVVVEGEEGTYTTEHSPDDSVQTVDWKVPFPLLAQVTVPVSLIPVTLEVHKESPPTSMREGEQLTVVTVWAFTTSRKKLLELAGFSASPE